MDRMDESISRVPPRLFSSRNPGGRLRLISGTLSPFNLARKIVLASFSLSVLLPPLCFNLMCRLRETSEPYNLLQPS